MADFAPPPGPPPPKVPEGWKAQFNQQYNEWFFVNTYTKKSQWDKPTEPVYPPPSDGAPDGPPPTYQPGHSATNVSDSKHAGGYGGTGVRQGEDDAALAARLQAEENARSGGGHSPMPGMSSEYYGQQHGGGGSHSPYPGQNSPYGGQSAQYGGQSSPYGGQGSSQYLGQQNPQFLEGQRSKSGGFLGKILGKGKETLAARQSGAHGSGGGFGGMMGGGHPQQGYGGGYGQPQHGYGGAPYGGGYGGGGYGGGYGPPKKSGGMGAGGAAALGVGGGLVGGMLLADAIDDHEDREEEQAYDQGFEDGGGDMGGDF